MATHVHAVVRLYGFINNCRSVCVGLWAWTVVVRACVSRWCTRGCRCEVVLLWLGWVCQDGRGCVRVDGFRDDGNGWLYMCVSMVVSVGVKGLWGGCLLECVCDCVWVGVVW